VFREIDQVTAVHPELRALIQAHNTDPYRILDDDRNLSKTAESLHTLLTHQTSTTLRSSLGSFFSKTDGDPYTIFPHAHEISEELLPILDSLKVKLPHHTTNLNFSSPVSHPHVTSINVIIRMYDSTKRNRIKIKIGAFVDDAGHIFWEVGFVDSFKSLRNVVRNGSMNFSAETNYSLLRKLVDCTKTFITRRNKIAGLDLTPAYYHVLQLCRRLGGEPTEEINWEQWNNKLEETITLSLQKLKHSKLIQLKDKLHKRYLISCMFERGLIKDFAGNSLSWNPPRLIWANQGHKP
jgi:hypothetical protein